MVVLNTVKRAIAFARSADSNPVLSEFLFSCNGVACPHHGRFARPDRVALDRAVSRRLGKNSPDGAVLLIGTQTLEQSLDIDADWLITDFCPIDVLLQRIGRLHRHERGARPAPVCTVLLPDNEDLTEYIQHNGEPEYGAPAGIGTVYEDIRILQLTGELISMSPVFNLPEDNRRLVESATHPERLSTLKGQRWLRHAEYLEGCIQAILMAAGSALIPDEHFGEFSFPSSIETKLSTRLGLDDRRLKLGGSFPSPFGQKVEEFDIPGHMASGLETDKADSVAASPANMVVKAGKHIFYYSRFGLEKVDESAHG